MLSSVKYVTSRAVMLERLDLLGFTSDAARRAFEEWRTREIERSLLYAEEDEDGVVRFNPETEALEGLGYELTAASEFPRRLELDMTNGILRRRRLKTLPIGRCTASMQIGCSFPPATPGFTLGRCWTLAQTPQSCRSMSPI